MEELSGAPYDALGNTVRKKRSHTFRRRPDANSYGEFRDQSPLSSTPASDDASKISSDETNGIDSNSKRKEFNLNQCVVRASSSGGSDVQKRARRDDGGFNAFYNTDPGRSGLNNKRSSEGVLAPANWKSASSKAGDSYGGRDGDGLSPGQSGVAADGVANENKVKKVKLKVGGVTRTIATSNGAPERSNQKQNIQGNYDNVHTNDKRSGLKGIPWKNFSRAGIGFGKDDLPGKMNGKNGSGKQTDKSAPVRKSKRVPKKRLMDGEFDDDDDEELRYLEKLKTSKSSIGYREADEDSSRKKQKLASVSDLDRLGAFKSSKDGKKKSRADRFSEDTDYEEEDDTGSEIEVDGSKKKKKQKKESVDALMDNRREMTLTTRQRALQSSKDPQAAGSSMIEFPNGLPPAPPRKQKEKLTEVEQQLKKSEAAQRRRMQNEKAARESEAEAIRKILGQDSSRKKREEKIKKRQEELAEEKAASESLRAQSTIRWVMGPSGTVVMFPKDLGLPSIFDSKTSSYPPPRENCAGPLCTNPYKYRDSKTKLPLCSLHCYKAVQGKMQTETIC